MLGQWSVLQKYQHCTAAQLKFVCECGQAIMASKWKSLGALWLQCLVTHNIDIHSQMDHLNCRHAGSGNSEDSITIAIQRLVNTDSTKSRELQNQ